MIDGDERIEDRSDERKIYLNVYWCCLEDGL